MELRQNNKGFSLLELVVAIAVLTAGITAVLQALSYSARITGLSCDITNAVFLAGDKMQEFELKEKMKIINKQPAELNEKKDKFTLSYTLNPDSTANLYGLQFDISWQRAGREEKLNLQTYLK